MAQHSPAGPYGEGSIPVSAGIGLKPEHYREIISESPDVGWFEIHPENYFGAGGVPHHYLASIRRDYPISFHGVGLSLGSAGPVDHAHVKRLKSLIDRYQPGLVSEHLSWSVSDDVYLNDLLPLPYTEESLRVFVRHVNEVQELLGRRILVENPSTYLHLVQSTISEPEFLAAVATKSDCGILLDVNNIYVSARNQGFDPFTYVDLIPPERVGEIHVAGHHVACGPEREILIDDHGARVAEPVWQLLEYGLRHCGPVPILVEWDTRVPDLSVLVAEGHRADRLLDDAHDYDACHAATV